MVPDFKNKLLLNILINLFILAIIILLFRFFTNNIIAKEGFSQKEKFILKRNAETYDDFYAQIYDSIHCPNKKQVEEILKITGADNNSIFLDVGCGTGFTLKQLADSGANCVGIDKSDAMVALANEKCANSVMIKKGDATEPIHFTQNQFTHILCLNKTIYEIEDKSAFFTNCRYWLRNGGVLVLHLVDKNRFNTVIGSTFLVGNPQKYAKERIMRTETDYGDFKYFAKYNIPESGMCSFTETFTDASTKNIRQNEHTLFMDSEENVLKTALKCGFSIYGKINMEKINDDEYQNIYILI